MCSTFVHVRDCFCALAPHWSLQAQADESDEDDDGEEPLIGPGSFAKQFMGALTTKRKAMMIVCAALCVIAVFGLLIDLNPIDGDLVCRCRPGW